MEKLLIAAVLACQPGDRLVDWRSKIPHGLQVADFVSPSGGNLPLTK
jgi:hypothetical protein